MAYLNNKDVRFLTDLVQTHLKEALKNKDLSMEIKCRVALKALKKDSFDEKTKEDVLAVAEGCNIDLSKGQLETVVRRAQNIYHSYYNEAIKQIIEEVQEEAFVYVCDECDAMYESIYYTCETPGCESQKFRKVHKSELQMN